MVGRRVHSGIDRSKQEAHHRRLSTILGQLSQWPLRSANKQDEHGGRQRSAAGERTLGQWAGGAEQGLLQARVRASDAAEAERGAGSSRLRHIACPLRDLNVVDLAILNVGHATSKEHG